MKPALLTLSFILFVFAAKHPLAFSQDIEPVIDILNNTIFADHQLYLLPSTFPHTNGGVKLGKTGESTCPVTVLQDSNIEGIGHGLPIIFRVSGITLGPGEIFTGGPALDIEFSNKSSCAKSSKWMVFVDNDIQKTCVGIGGPEDHPGKQTIMTGKFHIEEYKENYKLVFCESELQNCSDIGSYDNKENGTRLYLTEQEPFEVKFLVLTAD